MDFRFLWSNIIWVKFPKLVKEKYLHEEHTRYMSNLVGDMGMGHGVGEGRYIELVGDSTFRVKFGDKCMCEHVSFVSMGGHFGLIPQYQLNCIDFTYYMTSKSRQGSAPLVQQGKRVIPHKVDEGKVLDI
jgi:hypothetical protein